MKQMMVRGAKDDFDALLTADGMLKAGANVISITDAGEPERPRPSEFPYCGPTSTPRRFLVWATVEGGEEQINAVDDAIDHERRSKDFTVVLPPLPSKV